MTYYLNLPNCDQIPVTLGQDVTELLDIQLWSAPIPAQLAGMVKGVFPGFMPKTDQERCIEENTMIETSTGVKKIKDVMIGDTVMSYNHQTNKVEYKNVIDKSVMSRKKSGWFKVTLKSGKSIIVTHNHKIWVDDIKCYRNVDDLEKGNILKIYQKD